SRHGASGDRGVRLYSSLPIRPNPDGKRLPSAGLSNSDMIYGKGLNVSNWDDRAALQTPLADFSSYVLHSHKRRVPTSSRQNREASGRCEACQATASGCDPSVNHCYSENRHPLPLPTPQPTPLALPNPPHPPPTIPLCSGARSHSPTPAPAPARAPTSSFMARQNMELYRYCGESIKYPLCVPRWGRSYRRCMRAVAHELGLNFINRGSSSLLATVQNGWAARLCLHVPGHRGGDCNPMDSAQHLLPRLLSLSLDPVANVRVLVAKKSTAAVPNVANGDPKALGRFSLPGVALPLGRQNWHCLKDTNETLATDVQIPAGRQLILIIELYSHYDVYNYLRQIALTLCSDKVSEVRWISYKLLGLNFINELIVRFCHCPKWVGRQAFAFICQAIVEEDCMPMDQFAQHLLPSLLSLSLDPVANVRVLVAKALRQSVMEKDELEETVMALQADKDRDVRFFASLDPNMVLMDTAALNQNQTDSLDPNMVLMDTAALNQNQTDSLDPNMGLRNQYCLGEGTAAPLGTPKQLILIIELYSHYDVYNYLRQIALTLCSDKVSEVRWISYKL
ncbi:unnamed protein product, partial [Coregonus sp. 'balchen']